MNEMKMKAKKIRNELKVSDSKTYPLKNEERMKNGEERPKTFTNWIFFTETIFSPKTAEIHSQGALGSLEQPLFS